MQQTKMSEILLDILDISPEEVQPETYPFLSTDRVQEILSDPDGGPMLKAKDLDMYVDFYSR